MKKENKSFLAFAAAGIPVGAVSFLIGDRLLSLLLMALVAFALLKVLEKKLGKEKATWWIGNGMWIYMLVWAISWTMFYNLF